MFYISDGTRLFAETEGSGKDLVLLHPTPLHHAFWDPIVARLQDRYRITRVDLRGHGLSGAASGPIQVDRLGLDIERLLDFAHIPHALFAGCSIGSYVLYELWRRIPRRIDGLAFCCGKPQGDSAANRVKRQENIARIRKDGTAAFFDQMIETLVSPDFRASQPEKVAQLREMMNSMSAEAVIGVQQGLMDRPDSTATVKTITVPVFALAGGKDLASSPAEMRTIQEILPFAEYHELPEAGHFAPYEEPDRVATLLGEFFDRVLSAKRSSSHT
jgi:3-oxoadipate enol-lactonase